MPLGDVVGVYFVEKNHADIRFGLRKHSKQKFLCFYYQKQ